MKSAATNYSAIDQFAFESSSRSSGWIFNASSAFCISQTKMKNRLTHLDYVDFEISGFIQSFDQKKKQLGQSNGV